MGLTLGAGDLGVFVNDSIGYIHNYRSWEILDNGPLRSAFRVKYDPYTFREITVTMTKTISLDAGAQLSRMDGATEAAQIAYNTWRPFLSKGVSCACFLLSTILLLTADAVG